MKPFVYKMAGMGALCFALALKGMAQDDNPPSPPPPEAPLMGPQGDSNDNQSEIVIRQKGDKDSKVTIEIRHGDFFVDGKPLDKFEGQNIEIEKRDMANEDQRIALNFSPFRRYKMDNERMQGLMDRNRNEIRLKMDEMNRHRSNEAFLGVSSRRTETGGGATVLEVTKGSPAEKAGLKKGDILTRVNDKTIETPENLFEAVHGYKPGDKVKVTFKRDGKEQTVSATLDKSKMMDRSFNYEYRMPEMREYRTPEMPEMPGLPGMESPLWGPMPPKLGIKAQDAEDGKGASVLGITEGSAAEKAGLKKGDVITEMDGAPVNGADDLIQQVREGRNKIKVKLKIQRDGKSQELDLKIPRKLKTAEL